MCMSQNVCFGIAFQKITLEMEMTRKQIEFYKKIYFKNNFFRGDYGDFHPYKAVFKILPLPSS